MGGVGSDERAARVVLAMCSEPGDESLAALVAEHSAAALVASAEGVNMLKLKTRAKVQAVTSAEAVMKETEALGSRVLIPGDEEWPTQLSDLAAPPLALWVRGDAGLRSACIRSVSIVGARASTGYGDRVAMTIASDLAAAAWTVISGGAFGIDAAAHRGALAVDGTTIVVLAGGVDIPYPAAHGRLFNEVIQAGGLVVSECPPGVPPRQHRFLERNRLIAALTRGTLVVEAGARSGARATAARAADIGRVVMAVPGPITAIASTGTNEMIREGAARLVTCWEDVVEDLVPAHGLALPDMAILRAVIARIDFAGPAPSDELARFLRIRTEDLLVWLSVAEVHGFLRCTPGGWRRGPRPPVWSD